jgi:hypothetical protein
LAELRLRKQGIILISLGLITYNHVSLDLSRHVSIANFLIDQVQFNQWFVKPRTDSTVFLNQVSVDGWTNFQRNFETSHENVSHFQDR